MNNNSFFRQSKVLISRYFRLFFNDKQNLILKLVIPLLTIFIVCYTVCPEMYTIKPEEDHSINNGYPVLLMQNVPQEKLNDEDEVKIIKADTPAESKWTGEDKTDQMIPTKIGKEHFFMINSADDLAFLCDLAHSDVLLNRYKEYLTYNYILQTDVDFCCETISPIGTEENPFTGTFDGNGHKIRNFVLDNSYENNGLFGVVKANKSETTKVKYEGSELVFKHKGVVKNLVIEDAEIKAKGENAGAVVGCLEKGATLSCVALVNSTIEFDSGVANGGSIVGLTEDNTDVYSCYSTAKMIAKGKNCGGIIGFADKGRLSGCYYAGEVANKAADNLGMLIGKIDFVEDYVINCFYDKDINTDLFAISGEDYEDVAFGVTKDELVEKSSFLTPFLDVEKADNDDEVYNFKKDGQLVLFADTRTGLFYLVCVAIFIGICNSIQEICKERNILKREYMANLSLGSYVTSKLVVQACVCLVQMALVLLVFYLFVSDKMLPESGVIFSSVWVEYYISLFLLAFSSDVIALLISSIVKTSSSANNFIPIILIVQILFSGITFTMTGIIKKLSYFMMSKYGMDALAISTRLNDSQQSFLMNNPEYQLNLGQSMCTIEKSYMSSSENLLFVWACLIAFVIVGSIACRFILVNVKKDKR